MMTLLASLLAIAVAPLADRALQGRPRATGFADGLIQVVVGGILLVHVLPFGLAAAGWPALVALAGGALVGFFAHRIPGGERSTGAVAVIALLLHAGIDGAALASPDQHGEHAGEGLLAWAVVLHTLPVGLATWRISRQRAGRNFAIGLLLATAAVTCAGWYGADLLLHGASPAALGVAQCAVAGALLHVLVHASEALPRRPSGWGGLLGVGFVLLLVFSHPVETPEGELGLGQALFALLLASSPALLLGYLATTVLAALPVGPALARLGAAATLTLVVAGSPVGVVTLFLSVALLGGELTAARVGMAVLVAMVVLGALRMRKADVSERIPDLPSPGRAGLRRALETGFVTAVDRTAPWILLGLGVAALTQSFLSTDALAEVPRPLAVVAAALIGIPVYISAAGATPLAAVLLHKGLSAGAGLAFLVVGPAANAATLGALRRRYGGRGALGFSVALLIAAIVLGLAVDHLLPHLSTRALAITSTSTGPVQISATLAVLGLFAAALVRNGPAGFLAPLLPAHSHAEPHSRDGHAGLASSGHSHAGHSHPPP